jgi:hypothetical protein
VDTALRTSQQGVFAAGNVLHPVDTADIAALDGTFVADRVQAHLCNGTAAARPLGIRILADAPFRWVSPGLLRPNDPAPPRKRLLLWSDQLIRFPTVTISQLGRVIATKGTPWPASPGRVFRIPASVLDAVDPDRGNVTIGIVGGAPPRPHPSAAPRQPAPAEAP